VFAKGGRSRVAQALRAQKPLLGFWSHRLSGGPGLDVKRPAANRNIVEPARAALG